MKTAEKREVFKMKRGWSYAIPIALLLVIVVSAIGCTGLSSTTNPPSSSYPADIIGRVTIPKYVIAGNAPWVAGNAPGDNAEFWVVQVSVKNKAYQNPITSESAMWAVTTIPQYNPLGASFASPLVTIPKGQSGEMMFCFEVFGGLNPNDYQIRYMGQSPDSYGKLINTGVVVDMYDWDSKKVLQTPLVPYGTYVYSGPMGINSSWTFNRDATCSLESDITGKVVGTYTAFPNYISISDGIPGHPPLNIKYLYVDKLKCLYLYASDTDPNPLPYYRQ